MFLDEPLITSATGGDRAAITAVLERCLPGLLAYARLHAGERVLLQESGADIVQSVCRELLEGSILDLTISGSRFVAVSA